MLNAKQIRYIELQFESQGKLKEKEIADMIGITPKTICKWKKEDKEFQEEFDKEFRRRMKYAASRAFDKQCNLLDSKNDMVAHLAAKDIMDRAGFNPTDKIELDADMELNINIDYGDE